MADRVKRRVCKDCPPGDRPRPAPHPGPRCATHHRARQADRKATAHARMTERVYGLSGDRYTALKDLQGGRCAICLRATGATRNLSVDHDHATGDVRGLLCRPCNNLLGHARDEIPFFERAVEYLKNPPARRLEEQ